MSLLLIALVVSFFLPWSWTKAMWHWIFCKVWSRSSLKVGVEAGGRKLKSFKDEHLTKTNKPKEG
jgi:hypothetical protein